MKKEAILLLLGILNVSFIFCVLEINEGRNIISLDEDWEFKMDGGKDWKVIDIPHDFSISQKFSEKEEAEYGFFPGGKADYKKKFVLPEIKNKFNAVVYFYGAYKDTYVSINGNKVGENHYGYSSFSFDITKYIIADGKTENVLDVRVEHVTPSSRFYSGSGLFRSVELIITEPLYIAVDGLKITTPDIKDGKGTVKVEAEIINKEEASSGVKLNLKVLNKEGEKVAEQLSDEEIIDKGKTKIITASVLVNKPNLWIDTDPNLYLLELEILVGEKIVDTYSSKFGFRHFYFDKKKGFIINGVPRKLHGFSIHHDYGALGGIDSYDAAYKRLALLKEMGSNAIRTTHNTPHKTWLEICDELGIYVLEEFLDGWNHAKHGNHDFAEYFSKTIKDDNTIIGGKNGMQWAEYVIKSSVKRDRNNPSVIMWSLGNEVGFDDHAPELVKSMVLWGKEIDDTRLYTIGEHEVRKNFGGTRLAVCEALLSVGGILGYNYGSLEQIDYGVQHFGQLYLSETGSALNSRGVYSAYGNKKDDGKFHITSYDVSYASAQMHRPLSFVLEKDYLSGQFLWTGYDYIGEPTPWNKYDAGSETGKGPIPNSAYFGIIDTANFPKDTYYLYRSQLRKDSDTLHIVSAWDKNNIFFSDNSKKKSPVHIYTSVPKVDIFRDDKSSPICSVNRKVIKTDAGYEYYTFSTKSLDSICESLNPSDNDQGTELYARFNIEFKEGTKLYTKAYDENGKEIDSSKIVGKQIATAPNSAKLKLDVNIDKTKLKANGKSLSFVEVSIVDDKEILNTKGENLILFTLEGEGKILGVDNGDQATIDKFQQESVLKDSNFAVIKAYAGKALAIVSSTKKKGSFQLTISSEGFEDKVVEFETE